MLGQGRRAELELAVLGLAAFDDIERRYGERARIRRKGALVVHRDEAGLAAEPARLERLRRRACAASCSSPSRRARSSPGSPRTCSAPPTSPDDLQCDPRAIARAMAEEARGGCAVHTHTRVERILPGEGVRPPARRCGPTRSCSPPAPWSAELARGAGLELPLEPRKGQLVRLAAGAMTVRHKVFDGGYLAAVAAPEAGLQVSTVLETTWDGDVLVGSSRERAASTPRSTPPSARRMLRARPPLMPGVAAARGRGRVGRAAAVAAGRAARARALARGPGPVGRHRPRGRRASASARSAASWWPRRCAEIAGARSDAVRPGSLPSRRVRAQLPQRAVAQRLADDASRRRRGRSARPRRPRGPAPRCSGA